MLFATFISPKYSALFEIVARSEITVISMYSGLCGTGPYLHSKLFLVSTCM